MGAVATYAVEAMWDPTGVLGAFDEQFGDLSAWSVDAGSTFTVAANVVSNAAGSGNRMMVSASTNWTDWASGSRLRFTWVTGGVFYWYLHYTDINNCVVLTLSGSVFALTKFVTGSFTTVYSTAVVPVNGNSYWLRGTIAGSTYNFTLDNDSAGAPGSNVAATGDRAISDTVLSAGKMGVQMDGGTGMKMGGAFVDVCLVRLPWTDEIANHISSRWRRGRDYASQLVGRSSAGTLDIYLSNPSGRYAPLNNASPLFGKILPGRKVRIRSTSPTLGFLWSGFLEEIRPSPGRRDSAPTATMSASGPLRWIADKRASTAVYTSVATGTAVGYILDDAGWPAADRTVDAGQITMTRWKADGDSALHHLQELEEMEFGYIGESKDGKIVWQDGNHRITITTSQATFSDNPGAALSYEDVDVDVPWREVFNIFSAEVITFTVQSLATLWTLTGETPSLNPSETKDFWASYPTPDAAAQADHVDAWTTTTATTDMTANTQADGLGTDKTGAITIAVSKFANAMKISLTNTDAGVVYLTLLQARGTAVYRNDPVRIVSEDAASQLTFGKRTFPLPGKFYPSTAIAKSYVDAGIARYKDQLAIVSVRFQADQSSSHMTQALTRDVGERISVVANGTTASGAQLGIVGDFFIESEEHEKNLSGHWVTYALSDARTVSGYWLLGVNLLGTDTKLAL